MSLKLNVSKAFRLLCLPIVSNSDGLDFPETSESITNIVLFEVIRETLYEESLAVSRHHFGHFYNNHARLVVILDTYL